MNPWAAIVGRGKHGKAQAVRAVVAALRARGLAVAGVLQVSVGEGDGQAGYDLEDLATGARVRLARHSGQPEVCDYTFDPAAFAVGRRWAASAKADVIFAEVGHLEARGEGHWPIVADALASPDPLVVLLAVRPDRLTEVALRLPDPLAGLQLPASAEAIEGFADAIARREPDFL